MFPDSTDQADLTSKVWFEVALSRLLRLTDIPFLEDILTLPLTDRRTGFLAIHNSVQEPCIHNDTSNRFTCLYNRNSLHKLLYYENNVEMFK